MQDKAKGQQYLNPSEEQSLVKYLLRMSRNGFPIPIKYLRSLAFVIACQRGTKRGARQPKHKLVPTKRTRRSEIDIAEDEIEALGLGDYCTVLAF